MSWKENDLHTVLWIDGAPGCGKSVMSAFLSKSLFHDRATQKSMVYFFCDDKDEKLRTAEAVLANWLAQLVKQVPSSIVHFESESKEKDITYWTFWTLWRIFERIMKDMNTGSIWLLVDALGMSQTTPADF